MAVAPIFDVDPELAAIVAWVRKVGLRVRSVKSCVCHQLHHLLGRDSASNSHQSQAVSHNYYLFIISNIIEFSIK